MSTPVLVDAYAARLATGAAPVNVRKWLQRGHLTHHGYDRQGRALIDLDELRRLLAAKAA